MLSAFGGLLGIALALAASLGLATLLGLPFEFDLQINLLSFGVSALATTGLHLGQSSPSGFFHAIAIPLFIFTNFIIALLLIRTFALLMQGKLLIRTERAALLKSEDK